MSQRQLPGNEKHNDCFLQETVRTCGQGRYVFVTVGLWEKNAVYKIWPISLQDLSCILEITQR